MGPGILGFSLFAAVALLARPASTVEDPVSGAAPNPSWKQQVDGLFAAWDRPDSPGCALEVVHDGKLVYQKGYGRANLEHDVPITASTVFYVASTSKQSTTASILLLANRGSYHSTMMSTSICLNSRPTNRPSRFGTSFITPASSATIWNCSACPAGVRMMSIRKKRFWNSSPARNRSASSPASNFSTATQDIFC